MTKDEIDAAQARLNAVVSKDGIHWRGPWRTVFDNNAPDDLGEALAALRRVLNVTRHDSDFLHRGSNDEIVLWADVLAAIEGEATT